jgi:uncharacterized ParB-like nuclease family protein
MMLIWHELVETTSSTILTQKVDAMILQCENKEAYSCSLHYAIVNFAGVKPIHVLLHGRYTFPQGFMCFSVTMHTKN